MIKEGKFPIFGDGENRRSMGYTDNLAQASFLRRRALGRRGRSTGSPMSSPTA
jgi:hypothetical protein